MSILPVSKSSRFNRPAKLAVAIVLVLSTAVGPAQAEFSSFITELWPDAKARGVSRAIFDTSLGGFSPSKRVASLSRKQPEFSEGIGTYVEKRVTSAHVQNGRKQAAEWAQTLAAVEEAYGVDAEAVLAIWGMETSFGGYTGKTNTVHALATLAYEGRRTEFFRKELLAALEILTEGHIAPKQMIGSWAGAMGQTQFMPTSFQHYAVDHNGDGRKDIWNSVPDALASAANYLKANGWRSGETWGYEVKLPTNFDFATAWSLDRAPLSQWKQLGVTRVSLGEFPRDTDMARLYMPAGSDGPTFLLLSNFEVFKRYNNSDSYALSVGHLADRIVGGGSFARDWPAEDRPLNRTQRIELQSLLASRGFDVGTPDGMIGPKSRAAILAFQAQTGLRADGHASSRLLSSLR